MVPSKLILHCSATPDGRTFSWSAIRKYHMEDPAHLWSDIGYHYGLEIVDDWYSLLRGRAPWVEGAHCKAAGRNHDSVGLCVVGCYDDEPPDPVRYRITIRSMASVCWALGIDPREIYGHCEFESGKTCPGLKWDLNAVRRDVLYNFSNMSGEEVMRAGGVFL